MDSEPTAPAAAPATAPDGTAEPPGRSTSVALVPAPDPHRPARTDVWPVSDWLLAAPLGATKTLLDLTDAAADRLAALLGLRPDAR